MSVARELAEARPPSGLSAHARALWWSAAELRRRADEAVGQVPARAPALGDSR